MKCAFVACFTATFSNRNFRFQPHLCALTLATRDAATQKLSAMRHASTARSKLLEMNMTLDGSMGLPVHFDIRTGEEQNPVPALWRLQQNVSAN